MAVVVLVTLAMIGTTQKTLAASTIAENILIPTAAPQPPAVTVWATLHRYERAAIRNYDNHRLNAEIRQHGEQLWDLSREPTYRTDNPNCGKAAEALSYMVIGYHDARRRLEVPSDWHHYAKPYMTHREACLSELKLDPKDYRLPRWFGM